MLSAFTTGASATIMTTGCVDATSCSLEELVNGGEIDIDDVNFNSWLNTVNLFADTSPGGTQTGALDLSQIFVSGIDTIATGNPNEFTLGLSFTSTSAFSLPVLLDPVDESEAELDVDFMLSASGSTQVSGVELLLGNRNLGSPDSFVEINLDANALNMQVFDETIFGADDSILSDSQNFISPTDSVALGSNVQIGTFVDGDVELFEYSMLFTFTADPVVTPPTGISEPASASLLMSGLALFMLRRRRKNL